MAQSWTSWAASRFDPLRAGIKFWRRFAIPAIGSICVGCHAIWRYQSRSSLTFRVLCFRIVLLRVPPEAIRWRPILLNSLIIPISHGVATNWVIAASKEWVKFSSAVERFIFDSSIWGRGCEIPGRRSGRIPREYTRNNEVVVLAGNGICYSRSAIACPTNCVSSPAAQVTAYRDLWHRYGSSFHFPGVEGRGLPVQGAAPGGGGLGQGEAAGFGPGE